MSKESIERYSQAMALRHLHTLKHGQPYSRAKGGKRADLNNVYFRSRWEANIARYLNMLQEQNQIVKWEFEADTFWFNDIKRGTRFYIPDFKVWPINGDAPYYIEVKGWMDVKSKTKLSRMKKYYPMIKIEVLGAERYRAIADTCRGLIPMWEGKR